MSQKFLTPELSGRWPDTSASWLSNNHRLPEPSRSHQPLPRAPLKAIRSLSLPVLPNGVGQPARGHPAMARGYKERKRVQRGRWCKTGAESHMLGAGNREQGARFLLAS